MTWMATVLLLALWALALVSGAPLGNWEHLFLLFALVSAGVALVAGMAARRRVAAR
ncbi:MAG: hypothetical protein JST54_30680 [Deltaproteobacteria bacterium]|nr:hypothetical protein [Deltaproteobacteria bacterium]